MTGRVPRAPTSQAALPVAATPATFSSRMFVPETSATAAVTSLSPALPHFVHPSRAAARASASVTLHAANPAGPVAAAATPAVSGQPPVPSTAHLLRFLAATASRHGVRPANSANMLGVTRPSAPSARPLTSRTRPPTASAVHAPASSPRPAAIASGIIHSDRIAQLDLTAARNRPEASGGSTAPTRQYRWTSADRIRGRHASRSREPELQRRSNRPSNRALHTNRNRRPAHARQHQPPHPPLLSPPSPPKAAPRHRNNPHYRGGRRVGFDERG